jgi:hypothetical protein
MTNTAIKALYHKDDKFIARCKSITYQLNELMQNCTVPIDAIVDNPQQKESLPPIVQDLKNRLNTISKELVKFKRCYGYSKHPIE